jgi:hypothetical protein
MKLDPRKEYEAPKYEHPVDDINWTAGVGQPAGVYWLDGEIRMAAHESAAERYLLRRGAILAATLRFDRDPLDGVYRGGAVGRVASADAIDAFRVSGVN